MAQERTNSEVLVSTYNSILNKRMVQKRTNSEVLVSSYDST